MKFKYAKFFGVAVAITLSGLMSNIADASITIRENTAGTQASNNGYWGQSVVTTATGPWNSIEFNFFDSAGELAFGNLFLVTQEYLGRPDQLSAATAGYVAQAAAVGGANYVFNASLQLQSNTQYWFYTDATSSGVLTGNTPSGVPGENHYYSANSNTNFLGPFNGVNFSLTGNVVPEPGTLLIWTVFAGTGLIASKRRRKVA